MADLETPAHAEASSDDYFCQVVMSWPESKGIQMPAGNAERIALMKSLSTDWAEPFRSLVQNLPDDAEVISINMEDWHPEANTHGRGRVLLMGDAAHTMTMCECRGAGVLQYMIC